LGTEGQLSHDEPQCAGSALSTHTPLHVCHPALHVMAQALLTQAPVPCASAQAMHVPLQGMVPIVHVKLQALF
jgi:hypothetical protein